ALAEMDGPAVAVAQHLDLDVARLREIFLEIKRLVSERGLRFGARGGKRRHKLLRPVYDFHSSPAASSGGLEKDRKAKRARRRYRPLIGGQAAIRPPHHGLPRSLRAGSDVCLLAYTS